VVAASTSTLSLANAATASAWSRRARCGRGLAGLDRQRHFVDSVLVVGHQSRVGEQLQGDLVVSGRLRHGCSCGSRLPCHERPGHGGPPRLQILRRRRRGAHRRTRRAAAPARRASGLRTRPRRAAHAETRSCRRPSAPLRCARPRHARPCPESRHRGRRRARAAHA
jgi:hypothetical protein